MKDERQLGHTGRRLYYEGRLGNIPPERIITLKDGDYQLAGTPRDVALQRRNAEAWADWQTIASVLPRARSARISTAAIIAQLEDTPNLGKSKIEQRLAEYRSAVEEHHLDGPLCWEGKDGRGGYWRACECRMALVRDETTTDPDVLGRLRFIADPECDGDHGGGDFLTSCPTGIQGVQEVRAGGRALSKTSTRRKGKDNPLVSLEKARSSELPGLPKTLGVRKSGSSRPPRNAVRR